MFYRPVGTIEIWRRHRQNADLSLAAANDEQTGGDQTVILTAGDIIYVQVQE
jgi:hypothetical protein